MKGEGGGRKKDAQGGRESAYAVQELQSGSLGNVRVEGFCDGWGRPEGCVEEGRKGLGTGVSRSYIACVLGTHATRTGRWVGSLVVPSLRKAKLPQSISLRSHGRRKVGSAGWLGIRRSD